MHLPARFRLILIAPLIAILATSVSAQNADPSRTVRVTGIVRDEANAIPLPGIPVEVVGHEGGRLHRRRRSICRRTRARQITRSRS